MIALVCAVGIFFASHHPDRRWWGHSVGRWDALTFGFACTCFGLLVLQVLGHDKRYGLFRPIIGKDKRYSTSLAQIGLWTVAVVTAVAILLGRAMFEGQVFETLMPEDRWNQYLLLLGGPLAAAVVAKGVVTYKLASGTLQKSEPTTTAGSQVFKADDGSADLVDAQYLLFNVIALAYFVIQFVKTANLPEIPSTLLALTGATAATYVANKAAQKNAPRITSISTLTAEVGGQIVVYGENFDPGDRDDDARRVTLQLGSYTDSIYAFDCTDTRARFIVPAGVVAGAQQLKLTSTAGAQTEPHDIFIRAKVATVTETTPRRGLRPGSTAILHGENLAATGGPVTLRIGTMSAAGRPNPTGTELAFDVPDPLPDPAADTAELTISIPGLDPLIRTVPVDQPSIRSAIRLDDKVRLQLDGLVPERDAPPTQVPVHVNRRSASAILVTGNSYDLAPVANVDWDADLTISVLDDLGRRSAEFTVAADS